MNHIKKIFKKELNNIKETFNIELTITTIYCILFTIAPVFGNRIISLFGQPILMSAIAMPMVYGLIDLLNQNYGMKSARTAVVTATISRWIFWGFTFLLMILPTYSMTQNFDLIIRDSIRFMMSGIAATFISQYFIDIPVFDWIKRKLKRGFLIRYNLSNLISGLLHPIIFHIAAFAGTDKPIVKIIIMTYIFQVIIIAGVMSPVWVGINKLIEKRKNK